ncbi:hypothetical protein AKJ09_08573 [Labilithrix luteola]|uniref:Uncharacterized protein n=1 Tax=Labilithrix luteola TaxID=1391654 RepID=A0A0K1Q911_9BACT|nr:hypothetical protein AKJ09_08573 [Labilithrix luteola]
MAAHPAGLPRPARARIGPRNELDKSLTNRPIKQWDRADGKLDA